MVSKERTETEGECVPYLVRKIMRSGNIPVLEDWPENQPIVKMTADVSTNEFRSKDSELSTWRIEALEDLDIPVDNRQRYSVSLSKMLGMGV